MNRDGCAMPAQPQTCSITRSHSTTWAGVVTGTGLSEPDHQAPRHANLGGLQREVAG
jgi:hypothetical protein